MNKITSGVLICLVIYSVNASCPSSVGANGSNTAFVCTDSYLDGTKTMFLDSQKAPKYAAITCSCELRVMFQFTAAYVEGYFVDEIKVSIQTSEETNTTIEEHRASTLAGNTPFRVIYESYKNHTASSTCIKLSSDISEMTLQCIKTESDNATTPSINNNSENQNASGSEKEKDKKSGPIVGGSVGAVVAVAVAVTVIMVIIIRRRRQKKQNPDDVSGDEEVENYMYGKNNEADLNKAEHKDGIKAKQDSKENKGCMKPENTYVDVDNYEQDKKCTLSKDTYETVDNNARDQRSTGDTNNKSYDVVNESENENVKIAGTAMSVNYAVVQKKKKSTDFESKSTGSGHDDDYEDNVREGIVGVKDEDSSEYSKPYSEPRVERDINPYSHVTNVDDDNYNHIGSNDNSNTIPDNEYSHVEHIDK